MGQRERETGRQETGRGRLHPASHHGPLHDQTSEYDLLGVIAMHARKEYKACTALQYRYLAQRTIQ